MSSAPKKLNKAQAKAKEYVSKHKIEKLIAEMVNSLVHTRDKKPIVYMIKYLANYCTQEELEQSGISVSGPLPQRIPLMNFPEFSEECTSLLKIHLTKEIWSAMKKRATHLGGKIQLCVQSGVYDEKEEIGIFASDEEAYKVFDELFIPIIQDLHPDYDMKCNYKNEFEITEIANLKKIAKLKSKMSFIRASARRNFKDFPFTPMMSTQTKFSVEKKIVDTLGEVYGQYHPLGKIDEDVKKWIESVGIDITQQKSHDSAGINEDWPNGRGIFVDDNRAFAILVNFEDHIQVFTVSEDGDIFKNLKSLIKILSKFEKIGYARHTSLGFLTASPRNLGTTLNITCRLKLDTKHESDDLESYEGTYSCKINTIDQAQNEHQLTFHKTLAKNLTENAAVNELCECLMRLTENEVDYSEEPPQQHDDAESEHKLDSVGGGSGAGVQAKPGPVDNLEETKEPASDRQSVGAPDNRSETSGEPGPDPASSSPGRQPGTDAAVQGSPPRAEPA